jgi:hypothetical protein
VPTVCGRRGFRARRGGSAVVARNLRWPNSKGDRRYSTNRNKLNRQTPELERDVTYRKKRIALSSNRQKIQFCKNKNLAATESSTANLSAFLTGSAPQTEFDVTHSKQTLEKILTGARMHIKVFKFWSRRTQNLARVNLRKRYVIHLLYMHSASLDHAFPRISNRNCTTNRIRRNSLKTKDRHISNRNQNCMPRITSTNRNAEHCAGEAAQKVIRSNSLRAGRVGGGVEAGEGFGFVLECGDGV